jgi:hypothetical protein
MPSSDPEARVGDILESIAEAIRRMKAVLAAE